MTKYLRNFILRWLELSDHEGRLKDVEWHFVVKRDAAGLPIETLADVPLADRKSLNTKRRGMSVEQRRQWMEQTDGGRKVLQSN